MAPKRKDPRGTRGAARPNRPTITAGRGDHQWTFLKRSFLHVISTELAIEPDERAAVMHACFPDMQTKGYNADARHFRDIWNGRNIASHAKDWLVIARPRPAIVNPAGVTIRAASNNPYSTAEFAEFARIRAIVHTECANLGFATTSTGNTELIDPNLAPGAIVAPPQPPVLTTAPIKSAARVKRKATVLQDEASKRPKRVLRNTKRARYTEDSDEEMDDLEDESPDTFYDAPISEDGFRISQVAGPRFRNGKIVRQPRSASTPAALPMVHQAALTTVDLRDGSETLAAALSSVFSDTSSRSVQDARIDRDAYQHGGAVVRLYHPGTDSAPSHFADAMVCNTAKCESISCANAKDVITPEGMHESGVPFAHFGDLSSEKDEDGHDILNFYPLTSSQSGVARNQDAPTECSFEVVQYHNGFEHFRVLSLVCDPEKCAQCKANVEL